MGPKKIVLILAMVFLSGTIAVAGGMWALNSRKSDGDDPGRGPGQVAIEQEAVGQSKDDQEKDADAEDAVIERLVEILKNPAMSDEERVLACEALGKRGGKAKRALPEIAKFFGTTKGDKDFETKLTGPQLKKIMVAAAAIGPKSQENFKILTTALRHANDPSICIDALDALGRIGANSQKTFDLLLEGTKADRLKAPQQQSLRVAAVGALANLGATSSKEFKHKAKVELQLLSETEIDTRVRDAARTGLLTLEGTVAAAPDEDLSPKSPSIPVLLDNEGNGEGTFTFQHGRVDGVTTKETTGKPGDLTNQEMKDRGFTVQAEGGEVKVIARGAKPGLYILKVAAKGGKKGALIFIDPKYAPLTLSGLKEGMIERKIPSLGGKPLKLEMKIATGRAESVAFIGAKLDPEGLKGIEGKPLKSFRVYGLTVTLNDPRYDPRDGNPDINKRRVESSVVVLPPWDNQNPAKMMKLIVALSEDKSAVIVTVGEGGPFPGVYDILVHGRDAGGKDSSMQFSVVLAK